MDVGTLAIAGYGSGVIDKIFLPQNRPLNLVNWYKKPLGVMLRGFVLGLDRSLVRVQFDIVSHFAMVVGVRKTTKGD